MQWMSWGRLAIAVGRTFYMPTRMRWVFYGLYESSSKWIILVCLLTLPCALPSPFSTGPILLRGHNICDTLELIRAKGIYRSVRPAVTS